MIESILDSTKKIIGLNRCYEAFDDDLIMFINSIFLVLKQLGIGPETGFVIHDSSATWSDYIPDSDLVEAVKSYVGLKGKMVFDPPSNSNLLQALTNSIAELEWRLNVEVDPRR